VFVCFVACAAAMPHTKSKCGIEQRAPKTMKYYKHHHLLIPTTVDVSPPALSEFL
jgi:hypothetical protein